MKKHLLASAVALVCVNAYAIDPFVPRNDTNNAIPLLDEDTVPFAVPTGWKQTLVTNRDILSAGKASGYAAKGEFQSTFENWDMVAIGGANHEYVYIPMEVQTGAGVVRYNRDTGVSTTLMGGNESGVFESEPSQWSALNDDFGAFDPAVLSPWNSVLTAEEWSGNGRIFEIHNPEVAANKSTAVVEWLSGVPSVSHEGLQFDGQGRLYFVDESNSGSIYRYTARVAGDLSRGQTEVLVVDAFGGTAGSTWDDGVNVGQDRTGSAQWVAITDADGNATTAADPFDFTARGGRAAADEVNGTPFGRPEDLEFGTLGNGKDAVFFATTSENIIYSIELDADGSGGAIVREFVNSEVTPDSIGNDPVGAGADDASYGLDDPDNLAIDVGPNGELQLFIIEDEHPGDVWVATDADRDGVAEVVELFISLADYNSEPTGFIKDPRGGFLVAVQHPDSRNDALWKVAPVPVPGAVWLFGSALASFASVARRHRTS